MKRWQKALLYSVVWTSLTIGAGILHSNVILAGRLTPEQDEALSGRYGIACGVGLVLIWVVCYSRKQSPRK